METDYLPRREVARLMNCHPEYAQGLIDSKRLPMTRIGTANCVTRADFNEHLLPFAKPKKRKRPLAVA